MTIRRGGRLCCEDSIDPSGAAGIQREPRGRAGGPAREDVVRRRWNLLQAEPAGGGVGEEVGDVAGLLALLHLAPEAHAEQVAVRVEEGFAQWAGGDQEG